MSGQETVWVVNGYGATFPCGIFTTREAAEKAIKKHGLACTLTEYPQDQLAYDWAVSNGHFKPTKPLHTTSQYIGKFTSADQKHFHFDAPKS
jgi:hypothetical protein